MSDLNRVGSVSELEDLADDLDGTSHPAVKKVLSEKDALDALSDLRGIILQNVSAVVNADKYSNGAKLRFIHAVSAGDLFTRPERSAEFLEGLGEALQAMGDGEMPEFFLVADAFAKYGKLAAKGAKMLSKGRPYPALIPPTDDSAEEGHAQPKVAA